MKDTELRDGESVVDGWGMSVAVPGTGRRWLGKLWVTNLRAVFEPRYDNTDFSSAVHGTDEGRPVPTTFEYGDLAAVRAKKSFFRKSVVIELRSGVSWTFDYGILSVDELVDKLTTQMASFG